MIAGRPRMRLRSKVGVGKWWLVYVCVCMCTYAHVCWSNRWRGLFTPFLLHVPFPHIYIILATYVKCGGVWRVVCDSECMWRQSRAFMGRCVFIPWKLGKHRESEKANNRSQA
ncbi:hypothetical protein F5Y09DRAFT_311750 [Xylaria sp. FL1042]|nr:hypothetical protein F5Y09DRAFT_311750 [Xylaria sp. FL1042]